MFVDGKKIYSAKRLKVGLFKDPQNLMKNVVVTGIGINSCIGNTYKDVVESLQNGKSGISFNERYSDLGFRVVFLVPLKLT